MRQSCCAPNASAAVELVLHTPTGGRVAADSAGSPAGWHEAPVDGKHGDADAVVVLGLVGDNDRRGALCTALSHDSATGAEPAPWLRAFVEMWGDRGHIGRFCAEDYAPFFTAAVDTIGQACDDFVPQG